MPQMKKVIEELKARELRERVKVMVSGHTCQCYFVGKDR